MLLGSDGPGKAQNVIQYTPRGFKRPLDEHLKSAIVEESKARGPRLENDDRKLVRRLMNERLLVVQVIQKSLFASPRVYGWSLDGFRVRKPSKDL